MAVISDVKIPFPEPELARKIRELVRHVRAEGGDTIYLEMTGDEALQIADALVSHEIAKELMVASFLAWQGGG